MPPIEKVYEAYSAIADERIIMHDTYALVKSSDGKKTYEVDWKDNVYSSSDNATYWQGYPGYPVLAVLMLQGKLPYHKENAEKMKNVPWKKWTISTSGTMPLRQNMSFRNWKKKVSLLRISVPMQKQPCRHYPAWISR